MERKKNLRGELFYRSENICDIKAELAMEKYKQEWRKGHGKLELQRSQPHLKINDSISQSGGALSRTSRENLYVQVKPYQIS